MTSWPLLFLSRSWTGSSAPYGSNRNGPEPAVAGPEAAAAAAAVGGGVGAETSRWLRAAGNSRFTNSVYCEPGSYSRLDSHSV